MGKDDGRQDEAPANDSSVGVDVDEGADLRVRYPWVDLSAEELLKDPGTSEKDRARLEAILALPEDRPNRRERVRDLMHRVVRSRMYREDEPRRRARAAAEAAAADALLDVPVEQSDRSLRIFFPQNVRPRLLLPDADVPEAGRLHRVLRPKDIPLYREGDLLRVSHSIALQAREDGMTVDVGMVEHNEEVLGVVFSGVSRHVADDWLEEICGRRIHSRQVRMSVRDGDVYASIGQGSPYLSPHRELYMPFRRTVITYGDHRDVIPPDQLHLWPASLPELDTLRALAARDGDARAFFRGAGDAARWWETLYESAVLDLYQFSLDRYVLPPGYELEPWPGMTRQPDWLISYERPGVLEGVQQLLDGHPETRIIVQHDGFPCLLDRGDPPPKRPGVTPEE